MELDIVVCSVVLLYVWIYKMHRISKYLLLSSQSAARMKSVSLSVSLARAAAISYPSVATVSVRSFHSSLMVAGPKGDKKGGRRGDSDDNDKSAPALPSLKNFQDSIARSISWLQTEFDKNKFGSITPEYFQLLSVPGHGSMGKLGQITVRNGAHLNIAVYDSTLVNAVVDTVKNCGLRLNPVVDGTNVIASVPRPTKETRDAMIKAMSKTADKVIDLYLP